VPAAVAERREIVYRKAAELKPHPQNPRTHSDDQIELLDSLIEEYGWTNPLLIDEEGVILAGHGRQRTAFKRGDTEVPTITLRGLSEAQKWALVVADNQSALTAGWDEVLLAAGLRSLNEISFDLSLLGFSDDALADLLREGPAPDKGAGSLAEKFMVAPFSVLNAREGWWQDRKRAWLALGIKSELGRGGDMNGTPPHPPTVTQNPDGSLNYSGTKGQSERFDAQRQGRKPDARAFGQDLMRGEHVVGAGRGTLKLSKHIADPDRNETAGAEHPSADEAIASGTSIFDPVLCEIAYRWFSPPEGVVLDPFAGGSVRGIVAAKLGRRYVGIDLSGRQVAANRAQAESVLSTEHDRIAWHHGDSLEIASIVGAAEPFADMIFSCPPYADLEVYSDDPRDLSNMPYKQFLASYRLIVARAAALLRPDRFACFVVGEVRNKKGAYIDFVGDTVQAFRDAGLAYYNEAILITSAGSLPIRAGKQFSASRKLGKTHQNVLVFLKGDAKRAVAACGEVEVDESLLDAAADPEEAGNRYGDPL
jgi:hypothetical protein